MNYRQLYDALYSVGYHAKAKNHGHRYVRRICDSFKFKKILDVGCSNGLACVNFHDKGKKAYGIDVSEIAIRYANERYGARNCIIANAADIPFKDNWFDAVFSCDVLEHLTPEDANRAIKEICRVSSKYLFLVIDFKIEGNREFLIKVQREKEIFRGIDNLHLTIWPQEKWLGKFSQYGFKKITDIQDLMVFEYEGS